MAIPSMVREAAGNWTGRSRLYLPWLPEEEQIRMSESTLQVEIGLQDTYATLSYTWWEDEPQAGVMILAGKQRSEGEKMTLTGGWCDSWHQHNEIMQLQDVAGSEKPVNLIGEYGSADAPKWGWRIELELLAEKRLAFRMFNIDPEGKEEWAVDAVYDRC